MRNQIVSRGNHWIMVRGKGAHQSVVLDKIRFFWRQLMRVLAKISENLSQPATTLETTPEARSAPAMLSVNKVQGIPAFINATIVYFKMLQLYI